MRKTTTDSCCRYYITILTNITCVINIERGVVMSKEKVEIMINKNNMVFTLTDNKEFEYENLDGVIDFSGFVVRGLKDDIDNLKIEQSLSEIKEVYSGIFEAEMCGWFEKKDMQKIMEKHCNLKYIGFCRFSGDQHGCFSGYFVYSGPGERGFSLKSYVDECSATSESSWTTSRSDTPFDTVESVCAVTDYEFKVSYTFEHKDKWDLADYIKVKDGKSYTLSSINGVPVQEIYEICKEQQREAYIDKDFDKPTEEEIYESIVYECYNASSIDEVANVLLKYGVGDTFEETMEMIRDVLYDEEINDISEIVFEDMIGQILYA